MPNRHTINVESNIFVKWAIPQAQVQSQNEQSVLDKHSHTCLHPKHCILQYQVDNQHPAYYHNSEVNQIIELTWLFPLPTR